MQVCLSLCVCVRERDEGKSFSLSFFVLVLSFSESVSECQLSTDEVRTHYIVLATGSVVPQ